MTLALTLQNTPVPASAQTLDSGDFVASASLNGSRQADLYEPEYDPAETAPLGSNYNTYAPVFRDTNGEYVPLADLEDVTFSLGEGAPSTAWIDSGNGIINVNIPSDATSPVTIPVVVTYQDGSKDEVTSHLTPKVGIDASIKPSWRKGSGRPGYPVTLLYTGDKQIPENSYVLPNDNLLKVADDDKALELTIPETQQPGRTLVFLVTVRYEDGSEDRVPVEVYVKLLADEYLADYGATSGTVGETVSSPAPNFYRNGDKVAKPEGVIFSKDVSDQTDASVDPKTGVVTLPVPNYAHRNTPIEVRVRARYSDNSENVFLAPFLPVWPDTPTPLPQDKDERAAGEPPQADAPTQKQADEADASAIDVAWKKGQGVRGETVQLKLEDGKTLPVNSTSTVKHKEKSVGSVAPDGTVSVRIPEDAAPGKFDATVEVRSGSTSKSFNLDVTVQRMADIYRGNYTVTSAKTGTKHKVDAPKFLRFDESSEVPAGTTFALGKSGPSYAVVDKDNGAITLDLPVNTLAAPIAVPVTVTYKDGTMDEFTATVNVDAQARTLNHTWETPKGLPGEEVTVHSTGDELPKDTKVTVLYSPKNSGVAREIGSLQSDNSLKLTIPTDAHPDVNPVALKVEYVGGHKADLLLNLDVLKYAAALDATYATATAAPGATVSAKPTFSRDGKNTNLPKGTTFAPGSNAPSGSKVDPTTGEVTLTVPRDAQHSIEVPVVLTYPDKTTDNAQFTVHVQTTQKDATDKHGKKGEKKESEKSKQDQGNHGQQSTPQSPGKQGEKGNHSQQDAPQKSSNALAIGLGIAAAILGIIALPLVFLSQNNAPGISGIAQQIQHAFAQLFRR